ncbi:unnamed protein product [Brachionus calyciflorus]|uniref:Uncharacterized protein n=1 Tax=Brachionus calyciflorus TaxID=104777 RepID=A0A813NKT1_9BILA|nr:unnamed protein product [Brachionus calyciflorus]
MSHDSNQCKNCTHVSNYGLEQTLDEIDFEKSIFNACVYGDLEKVKQFVQQKGYSIINSQDKNGYTCLHYSARNNHFEICKYLLENGADVTLKTNSCKSTALHRAAFIGNYKIVKLLLSYNSSPIEQDCDGKTPVHKCLEQFLIRKEQKYLDSLKIMVNKKPEVINIKAFSNNKSPLEMYPELKNIIDE